MVAKYPRNSIVEVPAKGPTKVLHQGSPEEPCCHLLDLSGLGDIFIDMAVWRDTFLAVFRNVMAAAEKPPLKRGTCETKPV